MARGIGFYLSAVIAAGIIFIGGRFLLAPSPAAAAYGVPAGVEPHSRAYLSAKGIRDIASGLFIAILMAYGSAHVLGWFICRRCRDRVAPPVNCCFLDQTCVYSQTGHWAEYPP